MTGLRHGIHDIWHIIISMKCMVYGSKYGAVAVPDRVGMAECSLDLIFLIRDRPFVFLVWGGGGAEADFFQQLKLDFFYKQSESILFCNTIVYNCY